jgi:hypothetical protein
MLPDGPRQTLLNHLVDAVALAADGQLAEGYDCLLSGLRAAEVLRDQGVPWGEELSHRYRQAMRAFEERYGVPLS